MIGIVAMSLLDTFGTVFLPIPPMFLRIVRLARILRLLKLANHKDKAVRFRVVQLEVWGVDSFGRNELGAPRPTRSTPAPAEDAPEVTTVFCILSLAILQN